MTSSAEKLHGSDFVGVALLLAILAGIGAFSPVLPPTLRQDNLQYLAIARNLSAYFDVPGIYAQRIAPCAIVWGLNRAGVCDVVTGFCAVSYLAIGSFLIGIYLAFRHARLPPAIATTASLFVLIGSWPVVYGLSNVYQACDALAYPLGLAYCLAVKGNRSGLALAIGSIGLCCRQQLLVLFVLGDLAQFATTRKRTWLAAAGIHVLLFGLLVATAGRNGVSGLLGHTVDRMTAWSTAARGLEESRLPILLSPYLIALVVHGRTTWRYLVRYWWVAAYSLITSLQPLLAFSFTGPQNAARLAMMGLWPGVFLGGLIVGRNVQSSTGWSIVFVLTPLVYGTDHLVSFTAGWPSPLGHRMVANVLIAAISVAACVCQSRFAADRARS